MQFVQTSQECIDRVILLLTNYNIYIQELEHAQQKDLPFEAGMEPEGGTEPIDSPEDDWKETSIGYDCKFVESPPSSFQTECPVCRLLLRDPYQAVCCGTSFCHSCSQQVKSGSNVCPTCRRNNFELFPNKGLKRSIYQLRVFCTHRKDGCTWKGELGELEYHLDKVIHTGKSFHYGRHFIPGGRGF